MKTLKKVLSVVLALTMLLSVMSISVFAANTATVDITYYTDSAMGTQATKVAPGESVYALVTFNLPQATFQKLAATVVPTNATIDSESNGNLWDAILNSNMAGRLVRSTELGMNAVTSTSAAIDIAKAMDASKTWDNTANGANSANISSTTVPMVLYKLNVADNATGNVSLAVSGTLNIGWYDEEEESVFDTPFTTNTNSLPIESAAPADTIAYSAALKANKVDPESATLEADIKALVEVTRTVNGSGTPYTIDASAIAVNTETKEVTVTFPDDRTTGNATQTISYADNLMVIEYKDAVVTLDDALDYATYNDKADEVAKKVTVTADKYKNGSVETEDVTLELDTDFTVAVTFDEGANTGSAVVTTKEGGKVAGINVTETFTLSNPTEVYTNVTAVINGSPFSYDVTKTKVKNAVVVKADKAVGRIPAVNVTLDEGTAYTVEVDLAEKTATITMVAGYGTLADNVLNFEISDATYEYKDYTVALVDSEGTAVTTIANTMSDDAVKALVKVTADKYITGEATPAQEDVDLTGEVDITLDRAGDKITLAWKATSTHTETLADISVDFYDVIEYKNPVATMGKLIFAEGATETEILAELSVAAEKWVNNVKESEPYAMIKDTDYTVTYDATNSKVIVNYTDEAYTDVEIAIAVGVDVSAKITNGPAVVEGKVSKDSTYTATISLVSENITSAYGGEFVISVDKGTITGVTNKAGYTITSSVASNNNKTFTVEYAKDVSGTAGLDILEVTVDTTGALKDETITLTVDSMKVQTVEGEDISDLDATTVGATATVTIDEFVKATTGTLNAEIGIVTLGAITDAKFAAGVSIVNKATNAPVDVTGDIRLDGTNRKLVIEGVKLPGNADDSATTYTVTVEVPGYTSITADVVIEYVADENDADYNTWKVTSNAITADSKIYAGDINANNTIDADDYASVVGAYGTAAAYDLYEGETTINLNDIITMVWSFEQFALQTVSAAGIIE